MRRTYIQYAEAYNSILDDTVVSRYVLGLCRVAHTIGRRACTLCDIQNMDHWINVMRDVPRFRVTTVPHDDLDTLLTIMGVYLKKTYSLHSVHELSALSAQSIPSILDELTRLAITEGVDIETVKGILLDLSQRGYNRLQSQLQDIHKELSSDDPLKRKCELLDAIIGNIVQWVGIGAAGDAQHKEVCWYLEQIQLKHAASILHKTSVTAIVHLCTSVQSQMKRLENMHLKLSTAAYQQVMPVLRILLDAETDYTAQNLLYAVQNTCICTQDLCKSVEKNRKVLYLERWLNCFQVTDYRVSSSAEVTLAGIYQGQITTLFDAWDHYQLPKQ